MRTFLLFPLFLGLLVLAGATSAAVHCTSDAGSGVASCNASIPSAVVQRMAIAQERPNWCWAAALSIVFARHGHAVPQHEIVERLLGVRRDMPITSRDFAELINRDWFAMDGQRVQAVSTPRVPPHAAAAPDLALIVDAIEREQPVLLAGGGHVVVLVALAYERDADGQLRVTGGTVVDPWPTQGIRALAPRELEARFAARVQLTVAAVRDIISVRELARAPDAPAADAGLLGVAAQLQGASANRSGQAISPAVASSAR